jgi:hypothetical protein
VFCEQITAFCTVKMASLDLNLVLNLMHIETSLMLFITSSINIRDEPRLKLLFLLFSFLSNNSVSCSPSNASTLSRRSLAAMKFYSLDYRMKFTRFDVADYDLIHLNDDTDQDRREIF